MKITRGATFGVLLAASSVCQAQSVPGLPMTAKIRLENSSDNRTFQLISETAYFRDSQGRVRAEESLFDSTGAVVKRTVRIAMAGEGGTLIVFTLDPVARTAARVEFPQAHFSQAPPPPHQHPDDGTRFTTCAIGSQRWSADFPGIEILRCDKVVAGASRQFRHDSLIWREKIVEAQSVQPPASQFEVPKSYSIRSLEALQQQAQNEALRKFYQLQPPQRQWLLPPPQMGRPELKNPTFVPGEECDEFRLVGKERVVWQCKEKQSPLLRARDKTGT